MRHALLPSAARIFRYLNCLTPTLDLLFFAFPIAFEEVRGWNPGMTGTAFVSIIVSRPIALPIYA